MTPLVHSEFPLDPKSDYKLYDDFAGIHDKLAIESTSWSPMGISTTGSSLLAVSVHSDKSVHFKIFHYKPYYISIQFEEIFSLIDILRSAWFTIPLFTPDRGLLTDMYPSLSMCLEGYCQRSFVKWTESGLLVTGWGSILFLWKFKADSVIPVCAFSIPESGFHKNPIRSLNVLESAIELSIGTTSVDRTVVTWTMRIDKDDSAVLEVAMNISRDVVNWEGLNVVPILATNSSINGIYSFIVQKNLKSVQIFKRLKNPSLIDAIALLLHSAKNYPNRPLIDIISGLVELYVPRPGKLVPIDNPDHVLESMISRIVHDEPTGPIEINNPKLKTQLAFGLHHFHSRIDPIAASSGRVRQQEKSFLLNLLGEVLVDTMGNYECCFCQSVVGGGDSVAVCRICRIGITSLMI